MLTILMSNITVVLHFQNPWEITFYLYSAGTNTCTGCAINLADPLTLLDLPHWASPSVSVLPLDVPPSCCNLAPVISPCTVLLFILGS